MSACLFLDGPPQVGQTLTDGVVTVRVTGVDWKLDGSAVYGFSVEQVTGPPVTVTVWWGDGQSFTYGRLSDLDTFVGEDGTHHPLGGATFCYEPPATTTTVPESTTTTTVPESTTTTVAPTTTLPPTTTTTWWSHPECDTAKPPAHCPTPVTSPTTTVAPEPTVLATTVAPEPVMTVPPVDHGMTELPHTGVDALTGMGIAAGLLISAGVAALKAVRR